VAEIETVHYASGLIDWDETERRFMAKVLAHLAGLCPAQCTGALCILPRDHHGSHAAKGGLRWRDVLCHPDPCPECLEDDRAYLLKVAETGEPSPLSRPWRKLQEGAWTRDMVRAWAIGQLVLLEAARP
jgi:hypothetical protein